MTDEAARRIAAAAACAFLTAVFLLFAVRNWHRAPSLDEVEYLHTSLRMARGERIFTDFAQHHSPLFFAMLMPFAPDGNGVAAMQGFLVKARVFTLACTVAAMLAAALIVRRASGAATRRSSPWRSCFPPAVCGPTDSATCAPSRPGWRCGGAARRWCCSRGAAAGAEPDSD